MLILFAKDRATDEFAKTTKEKRQHWATSSLDFIDKIDEMVVQEEVHLENFVNLDDESEYMLSLENELSSKRKKSTNKK